MKGSDGWQSCRCGLRRRARSLPAAGPAAGGPGGLSGCCAWYIRVSGKTRQLSFTQARPAVTAAAACTDTAAAAEADLPGPGVPAKRFRGRHRDGPAAASSVASESAACRAVSIPCNSSQCSWGVSHGIPRPCRRRGISQAVTRRRHGDRDTVTQAAHRHRRSPVTRTSQPCKAAPCRH